MSPVDSQESPADPQDPNETTGARKRPHYLPALSFLALNRAVEPLDRAFDLMGVFLVGSCLTRPNFRDVDVRCILGDAEFDRLFSGSPRDDALWSLLCEGISAYLERATGLSIDFQIQRMSDANAMHHGPRNALQGAASQQYPGEVPSWIRTRRLSREGT